MMHHELASGLNMQQDSLREDSTTPFHAVGSKPARIAKKCMRMQMSMLSQLSSFHVVKIRETFLRGGLDGEYSITSREMGSPSKT